MEDRIRVFALALLLGAQPPHGADRKDYDGCSESQAASTIPGELGVTTREQMVHGGGVDAD
ncbi:hypothetical protein E2562_009554 [Oryza meyeriana var. granulata]|uniref:Uncharacterized protein n=1 Tax=Oryza meyeriana var. granulata TaxID=110450 RepID=A0A6G1F631_9ORYZ|nr:hypothetical protein E2562_009554 [Oryza meyeriana var. granulata]